MRLGCVAEDDDFRSEEDFFRPGFAVFLLFGAEEGFFVFFFADFAEVPREDFFAEDSASVEENRGAVSPEEEGFFRDFEEDCFFLAIRGSFNSRSGWGCPAGEASGRPGGQPETEASFVEDVMR